MAPGIETRTPGWGARSQRSCEFRTLLPGDDLEEIARVVTASFLTTGPTIHRSADSLRWRYLACPGSGPSMVHLALREGRVVGTAFGSEFRLLLGGRPVPFGMIDDVSTAPEARRLGVARRLVGGAVDALGSRGNRFAALYANPREVAQHLYLDLGFKVIHRFKMWFRPGRQLRLLREKPLLGTVTSPLAALRLRGAARLRRATPEVPGADAFASAFHRATAGLDMAPAPDPAYWKWKEDGPHGPRRVAVVQDGEISGGCRVVPQGLDIWGSTLSAHWLADLFLAPGADPRTDPVAAAIRAHPGAALWVGTTDPADRRLSRLFRRNGFLPFVEHMLMVKSFTGDPLPSPGKWDIRVESAFGVA